MLAAGGCLRARFRRLAFACCVFGAAFFACQASADERVGSFVLATGQLSAGGVGVFPLTLTREVRIADYLVINTVGSAFDTEIGLYDAVGRLVATNDDISSSVPQSRLRFGMSGTDGSSLAAGDYSLVLGGFNTSFGDRSLSTTSTQQGAFSIGIETTQPVRFSPVANYQARDGNLLPASIRELEVGSGTLRSGEVRLYRFSAREQIRPGDWFAIHTSGSRIDTVIGIFDAQGRLVARNDDIAPRNQLSRLSFGFDADDGASLAAGEYTLAFGGFNTLMQNGPIVTSSSTLEGDFAIYLQSSRDVVIGAIPEPADAWLIGAGLALLAVRRRLATRG